MIGFQFLLRFLPSRVLDKVGILVHDRSRIREKCVSVAVTHLSSGINCLVSRGGIEAAVGLGTILPDNTLVSALRGPMELVKELGNILTSLLNAIEVASAKDIKPTAALEPKLIGFLLLKDVHIHSSKRS